MNKNICNKKIKWKLKLISPKFLKRVIKIFFLLFTQTRLFRKCHHQGLTYTKILSHINIDYKIWT